MLQQLVHPLDVHDLDLLLGLLGDLDHVLAVALGQDDALDTRPVSGQELLFDATNRQHQTAQRDFAGHRHVAADRLSGQQ